MPKTKIVYSEDEVARLLRSGGFKCSITSHADDMTDGEVEVNRKTLKGLEISVQVGDGYLVVGLWDEKDESMLSFKKRDRVVGVIADIKKAIAEY